MDIYTAAEEYKKIMAYEYTFKLIRNRNSIPQEVNVRFDKKDFFHLCGLHKLKGRYFLQESKDKIFDRICNNEFAGVSFDQDSSYKEIASRIELVSQLISFFESDNIVFKTNPRNAKNPSRIQSDYILSYRDKISHKLFYIKQDKSTDYYHGVSCFMRSLTQNDTTDGHIKLIVLKKYRFNIENEEQIILIDRDSRSK